MNNKLLDCNINNTLEVSCIVNDYISYQLQLYLSKDARLHLKVGTSLTPPSKVSLALRSLGDEFKTKYHTIFVEITKNLDICAATAYATFNGVANELFSEGITWSRIVALFVFSSEIMLTILSQRKNENEIVDEVTQWLTAYITNHLSVWIRDHDGWDGLVKFHKGHHQASSWPALKNVACSMAAGIGVVTLAAVLFTRS